MKIKEIEIGIKIKNQNWSARGEAPLARHQCLLREERARWERFDLRDEIPILQLFSQKVASFRVLAALRAAIQNSGTVETT